MTVNSRPLYRLSYRGVFQEILLLSAYRGEIKRRRIVIIASEYMYESIGRGDPCTQWFGPAPLSPFRSPIWDHHLGAFDPRRALSCTAPIAFTVSATYFAGSTPARPEKTGSVLSEVLASRIPHSAKRSPALTKTGAPLENPG